MLGPERSSHEFLDLYSLFLHTRKVFRHYWEREGNLPGEEVRFLATVTLSHIDDIDTGFKWTLRTEQLPTGELSYVLSPADIIDWSNEPHQPSDRPLSPDLRKVMALRHAQVVFGTIPRTPNGAVSYPGYSSYADIKVPRTPMELRKRIEELAEGVWDAATRRSVRTLDPERSRRVYGFFEAGSWLAAHQARRMRGQSQ